MFGLLKGKPNVSLLEICTYTYADIHIHIYTHIYTHIYQVGRETKLFFYS